MDNKLSTALSKKFRPTPTETKDRVVGELRDTVIKRLKSFSRGSPVQASNDNLVTPLLDSVVDLNNKNVKKFNNKIQFLDKKYSDAIKVMDTYIDSKFKVYDQNYLKIKGAFRDLGVDLDKITPGHLTYAESLKKIAKPANLNTQDRINHFRDKKPFIATAHTAFDILKYAAEFLIDKKLLSYGAAGLGALGAGVGGIISGAGATIRGAGSLTARGAGAAGRTLGSAALEYGPSIAEALTGTAGLTIGAAALTGYGVYKAISSYQNASPEERARRDQAIKNAHKGQHWTGRGWAPDAPSDHVNLKGLEPTKVHPLNEDPKAIGVTPKKDDFSENIVAKVAQYAMESMADISFIAKKKIKLKGDELELDFNKVTLKGALERLPVQVGKKTRTEDPNKNAQSGSSRQDPYKNLKPGDAIDQDPDLKAFEEKGGSNGIITQNSDGSYNLPSVSTENDTSVEVQKKAKPFVPMSQSPIGTANIRGMPGTPSGPSLTPEQRKAGGATADSSVDLKNSPDFSHGGKDRYNYSIPASIRHNNPGATYPAKWMKKYGMNGVDKIGGGHLIANFPDAISGAAANFELWNRGYAGLTLAQAITKWSGGNSSGQYIARVSRAMGVSPDTIITHKMIADSKFMPKMLFTMSQQESGKKKGFNLTQEQWQEAHQRFREIGLGEKASPTVQAHTPEEKGNKVGSSDFWNSTKNNTSDNIPDIISPYRGPFDSSHARAGFMRPGEKYGTPGELYNENRTGKFEHLAVVKTKGGHKFVVNKDSAEAFKRTIQELEDAGMPLGSIGAYSPRPGGIKGSGRMSQHAMGNAIDIGSQSARNTINLRTRQWIVQHRDLWHSILSRNGMVDGGSWKDPDLGHIEWSGQKPWIAEEKEREKQGKVAKDTQKDNETREKAAQQTNPVDALDKKDSQKTIAEQTLGWRGLKGIVLVKESEKRKKLAEAAQAMEDAQLAEDNRAADMAASQVANKKLNELTAKRIETQEAMHGADDLKPKDMPRPSSDDAKESDASARQNVRPQVDPKPNVNDHIERPIHDPEKEAPSPGSDGYGRGNQGQSDSIN